MSGPPLASRACCPPRGEGITFLQVGPRRTKIGMVGLDTIFQQLWELGRRPDEASDAELVGMARMSNWIPDSPDVEAEYGTALREAYRAYFVRQEASRYRSPR